MAFVHENTVVHHMLGEDCPCHERKKTEHAAHSACVKCSIARDELVENVDGHTHCDMCAAAVLPGSTQCDWCGFDQISRENAVAGRW